MAAFKCNKAAIKILTTLFFSVALIFKNAVSGKFYSATRSFSSSGNSACKYQYLFCGGKIHCAEVKIAESF
jgi:hypothetical protein